MSQWAGDDDAGYIERYFARSLANPKAMSARERRRWQIPAWQELELKRTVLAGGYEGLGFLGDGERASTIHWNPKDPDVSRDVFEWPNNRGTEFGGWRVVNHLKPTDRPARSFVRMRTLPRAPGREAVNTNNSFGPFWFEGEGGYEHIFRLAAWEDGSIDENNEHHRFRDINCWSFREAMFYVRGWNVMGLVLDRVNGQGGKYLYHAESGGGFVADCCRGGSHAEASFRIDAPSGFCRITNYDAEHVPRLLIGGGASGTRNPVTFDGGSVRFAEAPKGARTGNGAPLDEGFQVYASGILSIRGMELTPFGNERLRISAAQGLALEGCGIGGENSASGPFPISVRGEGGRHSFDGITNSPNYVIATRNNRFFRNGVGVPKPSWEGIWTTGMRLPT